MNIKFEAPKGRRIKKGTYKRQGSDRHNNFIGVTILNHDLNLWWNHADGKWLSMDECTSDFSNRCNEVYNLKQFIRHMKKCEKYLPKETILVLDSRFQNYNIIGKL